MLRSVTRFTNCLLYTSQPVQREKMANDTYYLLTLAAIARELERRRLPHRCTVALASGLPLTSYGRQKGSFKKYLLRSPQPVKYRYEGEAYEVTVEGVWLYPQGYSALAMYPDLIAGEPSFLPVSYTHLDVYKRQVGFF